jgi:hypothetical protein
LFSYFALGKPGRFQGVNSGVVLFDLKKMRLNKLYNKYSEDEGVEELVKTYNMKLRSDFCLLVSVVFTYSKWSSSVYPGFGSAST